MSELKLAIAGCGYLGNIIADAYRSGYLEGFTLVGAYSRHLESAKQVAEKTGCKACETVEDLLALKPDYIAEAASGQMVKDIAIEVLSHGCNLIVLSIGAFADQLFYEEVKKTAVRWGTRVHIASGAVGGFDVLRTVSLMGEAKSSMETRKGPESLRGTSVFSEALMTEKEESVVFTGNAKEAIAIFPTKVNVAVAAALSTTGPDQTSVTIHSVPGMTGDDHKITAEIDGVRAVVDIYSKTSAIAGWSVVALLQNLVSPIVF